MPDAAGNFKGQGWSRKRSDAWERIFGNAAPQQPRRKPVPDLMAALEASLSAVGCGVPTEPAREDDWTPEDYDQRRSAWRRGD